MNRIVTKLWLILTLFSICGTRLAGQDNWTWKIGETKLAAGNPPSINISIALQANSAADSGRLGNHNLRGSVSADLYDFNSPYPPVVISGVTDGFTTSLTDGPCLNDWQWNAVFQDSVSNYVIHQDSTIIFTMKFYIQDLTGRSGITLGDLDQTFSDDNVSSAAITYDNSGGDTSLDTTLMAVSFNDRIPEKYQLSQNYPNPFNPATVISYQIPEPGFVEISVYNAIGEKVKILVADKLRTGFYTTAWNGLDDSEQQVAAGVYLLKLQAGDVRMFKKMILLR